MDLKQSKPMHFKCPKCGHDFSANTNKIVEHKQELASQRTAIVKRMQQFNGIRKKKDMPEYKRLVAKLNDVNMQLQAINQLNRNLSENAELEQYKVLKKLLKAKIGESETMKLVKEAEDCVLYRDYDTAVQRFNRFDGV